MIFADENRFTEMRVGGDVQQGVLEAIVALAEDISRAAPDCAEKARCIADLARDLILQPDRAAIQDAIESRLVDSEMSESQLQSTTSAVMGALKGEDVL